MGSTIGALIGVDIEGEDGMGARRVGSPAVVDRGMAVVADPENAWSRRAGTVPDALRPGPPAGRVAKREERRRGRLLGVTPRAALGMIVATAAAVALLGALLAYMVDGQSFDSFGQALWWAVVTVGTVGYGDVVPTNGAGRLVAAVMILFTMALFPILTGVVTATLIGQGQREASEDEKRQAEERQAQVLGHLRSLDARLARLEDRAP